MLRSCQWLTVCSRYKQSWCILHSKLKSFASHIVGSCSQQSCSPSWGKWAAAFPRHSCHVPGCAYMCPIVQLNFCQWHSWLHTHTSRSCELTYHAWGALGNHTVSCLNKSQKQWPKVQRPFRREGDRGQLVEPVDSWSQAARPLETPLQHFL